MISLLEWGVLGAPESLKMHGFPTFFCDFFQGMGSVGSPESLKMHRIPNIFHDFFAGMGSVRSPESMDFNTFSMIS